MRVMKMNEKELILIVDDTLSNIVILDNILNSNYNINVAINGEHALQIINDKPPSLILLDIMMPGLDGYEVCRRLQANKKTKRIPVIFITAKGEVADEQKGFEYGAVDYITKPVSPPIVLARVRNHLELKQKQDNLEELVTKRTQALEKAFADQEAYHKQIFQQERLASIGQIAAGVAHEINNPTGFIASNLRSLKKYLNKIEEFQKIESKALQHIDDTKNKELKLLRKKLKIDFIIEDIHDIITESLDGCERIKKIVTGLKNFSRKDQDDLSFANINDCIKNTLNVVWNELKYKATLQEVYGDLPLTKCYPQQLNQVFMNLLVNAAHAIENQGIISIKTWEGNNSICASVSDTGCGIPANNLEKIFEAFFTTKDMGKGTGLGMSISSEIIKKHKGEIKVESEVGIGTTFTVQIPSIQ